jgi:hypothetical protein
MLIAEIVEAKIIPTLEGGYHPLFKPNIPFFHHSIGFLTANTPPFGPGVKIEIGKI